MNQDNNWINDYIKGQLAEIKVETNWWTGYTTIDASRAFERVDKDKRIRDLEARVKELESILAEEI